VAAPLLGVSEPTVRSWTRRGLLVYADGQDGGLDVRRLYEVIALVRELRAAGQTHDLLNKVWYRLADNAVLERLDLRDSLAQMRRGDGIPTDIDELERDLGIAE
jgi:phage terminase Nu1 subunit (DNA packaging protein)